MPVSGPQGGSPVYQRIVALQYRSSPRLPDHLKIPSVEGCDLVAHCADVALVLEHVMCGLQALGARSLGVQNGTRLLDGRAVSSLDTPDLEVFVAIDDEHPIELTPEILLDKQRNDQNLIDPANFR